MSEEQLAETSAPPLPPGIGTSPDTGPRDNRRAPILPITPRLPGGPAAPPAQQQPPPAQWQSAAANRHQEQ